MIKLNRDPSNLTIEQLVEQGYVARIVARHYNPSEHGNAWSWVEKNGYVQSYPPDYEYVAEQLATKHWEKNIGDIMKIGMLESGGKLDPNKLLLALMQFITDELKRRASHPLYSSVRAVKGDNQ